MHYIAAEEQLVWRRNTSETQRLDVTAQQWQELHSGQSNGWRWQLLTEAPEELPTATQQEWDELFTRFVEVSRALLPQREQVQLTLYLPRGDKQQVRMTTHSSERLEIPYVHWREQAEAVLPEQFNERVDLLAALGAELQLAAYVSGDLPRPNAPEAALLKKHANSACWRLAVRPALALDTTQIIQAPPSAFASLTDSAREMYLNNRTDVQAQQFYTTVLLVNEADGYMAEADLNWPLRGSDTREINALLDFCKSYLMTAKDPRT
ncbi:hypothetical protein CWI80_06225 [Pseudidiomarina sediminum]|uniref:Uncharacterized protein n=1 Tax=Pseudidiomarina sediminum TaxID=431675 RepID=A0A432ZAE2_9GAMM|nr:hypothetical protein [Pseudidiomarina sediminum]RUO74923.1 hypothetical protein CWI80_06225 [Pseudidiomarina sediminum]